MTLRERLIAFESPDALGNRKPSSRARSAFRARSFQPHMTLLRPGSGIDPDLTKLGATFRAHFDALHFDRFQIDIALPRRRFRSHDGTHS
jgi:2'-5' RNA ligase